VFLPHQTYSESHHGVTPCLAVVAAHFTVPLTGEHRAPPATHFRGLHCAGLQGMTLLELLRVVVSIPTCLQPNARKSGVGLQPPQLNLLQVKTLCMMPLWPRGILTSTPQFGSSCTGLTAMSSRDHLVPTTLPKGRATQRAGKRQPEQVLLSSKQGYIWFQGVTKARHQLFENAPSHCQD